MLSLLLIYLTQLSCFASASQYISTPIQALYSPPSEHHLRNRYIVEFHEGHNISQHFIAIGKDLSSIKYSFLDLPHLPGYSAVLDDKTVHEFVRYDAGVRFVEHDASIRDETISDESPKQKQKADPELTKRYDVDNAYNKNHGAAMIAAAGTIPSPPPAQTRYPMVRGAGYGVHIYIFDSGIDTEHAAYRYVLPDGTTATRAVNFKLRSPSPFIPPGNPNTAGDVWGHGTKVAGVAGANLVGIARNTQLVNVKVTDDNGVTHISGVIKALGEVIEEHNNYQSGRFQEEGWRGSVINMSWGKKGELVTLEAALGKAFTAGIPVVVSAGNGKSGDTPEQAGNYAPCRYDTTICVGGVDSRYRPQYSNYGSSIFINAPSLVTTTGSGTKDGKHYGEITAVGTSVAAPAVAGIVAIFVSWESLGQRDAIPRVKYLLGDEGNALKNVITGLKGSTPNLFALSGIGYNLSGPFFDADPFPGEPYPPTLMAESDPTQPIVMKPDDPQSDEVTVTDDTTTNPPAPSNPGAPLPSSSAAPGTPVKAGTELRILPLGDSITSGYQSSDNNGYRLELLNDLSGDRVVFAGTQQSGTMGDNWHEGYPGKTIRYISNQCGDALNQQPNVVLLMAGTNDMDPRPSISTEGDDPFDAAQRLGSLIDKIFTRLPKAVVLVATLPGVTDNNYHADNIRSFNTQIPGVVAARQDRGFHVATVGMDSISGSLIQPSNVHPTDQGYDALGDIWFSALQSINKTWIVAPAGPDPDHSVQNPGAETPGNCPLQRAPGGHELCVNTPIYSSNGITGDGGGLGPSLYGPVTCAPTPGTGRTICRCTKHDNYRNPNGAPRTTWDACYADEIGGDCTGLNLPYTTAVRLADIDGDGMMDYLHVQADSSVLGFETVISPSDSQAHVGYHYHRRIARGVPGHENIVYDFRHEIQFADLNGDGLADYIWTHPNGSVHAWFNAGTGWCNLDASGFRPQGMIARGIGKPGYGVHHVDLNGDSRADYVYVAPDGTTTAWINRPDPSFPGGIRYVNSGVIHGPKSEAGSRVAFADINGKGSVDYLMIGSNGRTIMDFNTGPRTNDNDGQRYWQSHDVIATGVAPDYAVLYGDLNGDGRAEYNVINADNSAIGTFYASCAAYGNSTASGVFCRDPPPGYSGDNIGDMAEQIYRFCNAIEGKAPTPASRLEDVGPHTSLTILSSYAAPNHAPVVPVTVDSCSNGFFGILRDCPKPRLEGTFIGPNLYKLGANIQQRFLNARELQVQKPEDIKIMVG